MEDKFTLIIGLVLVVLTGLLITARKFLEKYAPTTETTKDDEVLERIKKIEAIVGGLSEGFAKSRDGEQK